MENSPYRVAVIWTKRVDTESQTRVVVQELVQISNTPVNTDQSTTATAITLGMMLRWHDDIETSKRASCPLLVRSNK
jgi:hypothetical protein